MILLKYLLMAPFASRWKVHPNYFNVLSLLLVPLFIQICHGQILSDSISGVNDIVAASSSRRQYVPGNKIPINVLNGDHSNQGDLVRFRTELMYPYQPDEFTSITSSKSFHDEPLPFQLPFFGFKYTYIWVQKDGYLAFSQGQLSYKFPLKFPYPPPNKHQKGTDPSIIAPFFALQDIPSDIPNAGVYLRIVDMNKETNETLRNRIYADFREGMIGASNFVPKFAIIITWKNMTFANKAPDFPLKANSYQAVLATDEMRTYVMFNYEQIEWISPFFEGTKGPWAYVGFNAGNSTRTYEFVPYSQNPRISYLSAGGYGNGLKGRYFFQIDEEIWSGACVQKDLDPNLPSRLPLAFFPKVGNMLGGTMVNVTGPCLNEDSIIECMFENWPVRGIYRDRNHATCISPPVMYHGYVDLSIRVDGHIDFYGRYYIQPPDIAHDDISVVDNADREEEPEKLIIKWKPEKLSWNLEANAKLSLWGYRESDKVYPSLTYIAELEEVQLKKRTLELLASELRNRYNPETNDIMFGFLALNLSTPDNGLTQSPIIWSRAMPLSWYFKKQWEKEYGHNGYWKRHFCQKWFDRESFSDYFATTVFRCPCTLDQAYLDRGHFSPDLQCNDIDRKCDTFHRGALHCIKTGRPSIGGSGQTCCYDEKRELLQTADTMYGGRPSRAYVYGKHPFKSQMMIPVLSEYYYDIVPFFFCCKWQHEEDNADTCQMYNYWRTSQDCSSYQPPAIASVFGDPHIITFDMLNYTFNGKGEFTLTRVDNPMYKFELQGRFEQIPPVYDYYPTPNATFLTAIAVKDNTSSVVEIRVRPFAASWRYQMYVLVDKEYIFWWDESMQIQNFYGVTLYQPAGIKNMSHIIAMFDSGAGVEVTSYKGRLTVHVYAPYTFINSTTGLLGNYSRQLYDEFVLSGQDNFLPINSPPETIYKKMSETYRVLEKVSPGDVNQQRTLFFHNAIPYSYYDDPNFVPEFHPTLPSYYKDLEHDIETTCSDSMACRYDYLITYDKEYARLTKNEETISSMLARDAQKLEIRCPALPKPLHGRKSDNRYWPGIIVRFSCNDGYRLVGYEARRCREDGLWSWGVDPECISNSQYIGRIAGISVPIVIVLIIILLFACLFIIFSRKSKQDEYETYERGDDQILSEMPAKEELNPSDKNDASSEERM